MCFFFVQPFGREKVGGCDGRVRNGGGRCAGVIFNTELFSACLLAGLRNSGRRKRARSNHCQNRPRWGGRTDESRSATSDPSPPAGEVSSERVLTFISHWTSCTNTMNSWRNKSCSFFPTLTLFSACVGAFSTESDTSDIFNPRTSSCNNG